MHDIDCLPPKATATEAQYRLKAPVATEVATEAATPEPTEVVPATTVMVVGWMRSFSLL